MTKTHVYAIAGVLVLGVLGIVLANLLSGPDAGGTELRTTEQIIENPRPAAQPRANTFGIMTPEEKAAAEAEAARKAAEAALASSSASSTATSTATTTDEAVEEEV